MPHANWPHPTSEYQSTLLASSSILVASVVLGMMMTTRTKIVEFSFYPPYLLMSFNAKLLVVAVVVAVCRAPGHRFPLSAATQWHPLTLNARKWVSIFFLKNLCYSADLVCFVESVSVTCPSIHTDPLNPPPDCSALPRNQVYGLQEPYPY